MIVAHFKDHFLPPSETFIFNLISSLENTRSIILDRHRLEKPELHAHWPHFSPATRFGLAGSWMERAALRFFSRSPYLEWALRSQGVQLVHAHFGQLGAAVGPVVRRLGLPLVTSFHGRDVSYFAGIPRWRRRFDELWKIGNRFLTVGPAMADRLVALGCPEEKVEVLPLPIDLSVFRLVNRSARQSGGGCGMLSVGRLVPKKGMDVLIRAAALLKPNTRFRLRIVGDGPERSRLETLVNEFQLGEQVTFPGWCSPEEVVRCMADSRIFVLASRKDPRTGETEGSPTVLLEAQATGLPVVSTVHADIPSIVRHGESGFLVPEAEPDALARAIKELIDNDTLRDRMGNEARRFVESAHDKRVVGARLEEIYRRVLRDAQLGRMPD